MLLCVLPACLTITRAADFWHQATLLSSTFLCFGALAAVLLSTLQYGFSQFVVLPQSQSGVYTSMHTHTRTHTHNQIHSHSHTVSYVAFCIFIVVNAFHSSMPGHTMQDPRLFLMVNVNGLSCDVLSVVKVMR